MIALRQYHLYNRPVSVFPADILELPGLTLRRLNCEGLSSSHFDVSFEQAVASLYQLERMFVEMDGSFVWTGQNASQNWQLDGMLYDRQEWLHRVELNGSCPRSCWEKFLPAFGWPQQSIIVHLIELHCFVELNELLEFFE